MRIESKLILMQDWEDEGRSLNENGYRLAMLIGDRPENEEGILIRGLWAPSDEGNWQWRDMRVSQESGYFPSLAGSIPAAFWFEKDITNRYEKVPVLSSEPVDPVLSADSAAPIEASVRVSGPLHFVDSSYRVSYAENQGKLIETRLIPGTLHRGMEMLAEGKSPETAISIAERICGSCSFAQTIAFAKAVEQALAIPIADEQELLRTLFMELERFASISGWVADVCRCMGYSYGQMQAARIQDEMRQSFERSFGSRFPRGMIGIGGLLANLSSDEVNDACEHMLHLAEELEKVLQAVSVNDWIADCLKGIGQLKTHAVNQIGAVGWLAMPQDGDALSRFFAAGKSVQNCSANVKQLQNDMRHISYDSLPTRNHELVHSALKQAEEMEASTHGIGESNSAFGEILHYVRISRGVVNRFAARSASSVNARALEWVEPGDDVEDLELLTKSFGLCYACIDR